MRETFRISQVLYHENHSASRLLFGICWLSQCVEAVLPFALPASIIGMAALLVLLGVGIIRTEHIQEKSDFLLGNLPFFFVPAVVSIMNYTDVLRSNLVRWW